jgi:excisionase family DNA binding protein
VTGTGDRLTITEAAELLGVHRNTVRNRIKAGTYKASKVLTPQGETYVIERDSLDLPSQQGSQDGSQPPTDNVHHNPRQDVRGTDLTPADFQAANEAAIQRLLEPFVRDLSAAHERIGRLEAERDQLQRERDDARAEHHVLLRRLEARQGFETAANDQNVDDDRNEAQTANSAPWWAFWRR